MMTGQLAAWVAVLRCCNSVFCCWDMHKAFSSRTGRVSLSCEQGFMNCVFELATRQRCGSRQPCCMLLLVPWWVEAEWSGVEGRFWSVCNPASEAPLVVPVVQALLKHVCGPEQYTAPVHSCLSRAGS